MKRKIVVLSIGAVFLVCASALFAEDRLVPSVYPTIQAGINAAQPGEAVVIAAGTYTGAGNRDLDFGGSAITVRSADPNNPAVVAATVIDSEGSSPSPHRAFHFHSGETTSSVVAGLTITGGYMSQGGGIYCTGSSPTIMRCVLSGNEATMMGGGLAIESCSPMVVNCIFSGNIGGWYGGGINNYDSSATVKNCVFSGNGASAGGGMANYESSTTIINCTFSGNYADQGGGICNFAVPAPGVSSCVLWGDIAPLEPEIFGDCSVSYSDVQGGYAGEGNIDADPCFADAMGGDYHLVQGSPCIDAGDPGYSPAPGETDIDGQPRAMGLSVDMGADESPAALTPIIEVWPTEFEFSADEGGPNPASQTLNIRNDGFGTLNWEITEDCPWVDVAPSSGESSGEVNEVTISVDVTGLAGRVYECELTVSDPCASNNPQVVSVGLFVQGPKIELSASELTFAAHEGFPDPADQIMLISNSGGGILNWQISEDCNWLSVEPNWGDSAGEPNEVTVSVNGAGSGLGYYLCSLTISDVNATNSPQTVQVRLSVYPAGVLLVPSDYPTIQAAIDAAKNGETVIVEAGVYTGDGNRDLDFHGKAITIRSTNPEDPNVVAATVIYCFGTGIEPHRGFIFQNNEDSDSVVDGLTITDGYAEAGGGIYCFEASPTIRNCIISDNRTLSGRPAVVGQNPAGDGGNGGGMCCSPGCSPVILNCTITENWTGNGGPGQYDGPEYNTGGDGGNGGGVYCSSATIVNCTISGNDTGQGGGSGSGNPISRGYGGDGGGIYCTDPSTIVSGCKITGNTTGRGAIAGYGGGVRCSLGTIEDCVIWLNRAGRDHAGDLGTAGRGGGISCSGATVRNCLLYGNSVGRGEYMGGSGGGIYASATTIEGCTIADNECVAQTAANGGGVYCAGGVTIRNTIVWGNYPNELWNPDCSIVRFCDIGGNVCPVFNISVDPLFVAGPRGDYYLSQTVAGQALDSPCIDLGSDTAFNLGMDVFTTRTDEIGDGGIVDMGYHYSMPHPADIDGDGDVDEVDYAILASQWRQAPSVPSADIAPPGGNGVVDGLDLELLARNYLWGK